MFLCITYYHVHTFSTLETPSYLKILIFLCWALSFNILILVPLDIYYSQYPDLKENQYIQYSWKIMYWGIQLLTWILLPISQDYESSGYFTHEEKM
jgi:hypothetical protein